LKINITEASSQKSDKPAEGRSVELEKSCLNSAVMNLVKHKVCSNVSGGLPWLVGFVVLPMSFILITAIIIVSCGGVVRLPWYVGGLEFSGRRPQERIAAETHQRPQERIAAGTQVLFITNN
jgi:hypothetical protein